MKITVFVSKLQGFFYQKSESSFKMFINSALYFTKSLLPEYFKGVLHLLPQKAPKLACFVLYLKIINIFWKNNICIL